MRVVIGHVANFLLHIYAYTYIVNITDKYTSRTSVTDQRIVGNLYR